MSISTLRPLVYITWLLRLFVISATLLLFLPINNSYAHTFNPCNGHGTSNSAYSSCFGVGTPGACTLTGPVSCGTAGGWQKTTEGHHIQTFGFNSDHCVPPEELQPDNTCAPPAPTTCDDASGSIHYSGHSGSAASQLCVNNCIYEKDGAAFGLVITNTITDGLYNGTRYKTFGVPCEGTEPTNNSPTNANVDDSDFDGIPEIDGTELPPTPPPSNGCILQPDGSLYCGGGAPTPPAPDNGTPGMQAAPDHTVTNTQNNTTNNYFGSGTVANGTSGTPDGSDDGVCDPLVETCGTDQESAEDFGCGQLPTCTGDAIQCAILKMQHDTRCNLQTEKEDTDETEVMSQIGVTETVEDYFAIDPGDPDSNIDVGTFITTTPGTSACPADFVINVGFMPTAVTIPNQPICDFLSYVRPAVIALSYLVSGLMLFSAFKEGL